MPKDYGAILQEKDRWTLRKRELEVDVVKIEEEEKRLAGELAKMREQISYYDSLTRDMKREMQPPGVSSMFKSI
jgi:predicted  nucleic acid-binding Zn-ribbon protein